MPKYNSEKPSSVKEMPKSQAETGASKSGAAGKPTDSKGSSQKNQQSWSKEKPMNQEKK
jgi:hypothetical protein